MKMFILLAVIALGSCLPAAAQTDKVAPFENSLREALKQYKAGKIAESEAALDQARVILEKAKSARMSFALPEAPAGWEAEEMKTEEVAALLGGGKLVKKLYKNKSGQQQVQLEVFYGSDLIKLVRGLIENEDLAKSQGIEIKRAGGEKVLVKKTDAKNHEITMPLEDTIMVRLTGKEGAEEAMMLKMMREVDRQLIKTLVQP